MIPFGPITLIPLSFVLAFGPGACGSSSSNGNFNGSAGSNGSTGGSLGSGGTTGAGGTSGGGGTTAIGSWCDVPPCLAKLITGCTPSGTCIRQMSGSISTGITANTCYSNGVKQSRVETLDSAFTSATFVLTFSRSGITCFSEGGTSTVGAGGNSGSLAVSVRNGSGVVVATVTLAAITGETTVTWGGQTYTVTNMGSCGMTMPNIGGTGGTAGADCTQGSCP